MSIYLVICLSIMIHISYCEARHNAANWKSLLPKSGFGTADEEPPEGLQKWRLRRRRRWNEPAADGRVAAHLGVLHALDLPATRMAAPGEEELFSGSPTTHGRVRNDPISGLENPFSTRCGFFCFLILYLSSLTYGHYLEFRSSRNSDKTQ